MAKNIKSFDLNEIIDNTYEYEIYEDGIEITKYIGEAQEELVIPDFFEGQPVVSLGESFLSHHEGIKRVIVSKYVIVIKEFAFSCMRDLREVLLPSSLRRIGNSAFWGIALLAKVNPFINASLFIVNLIIFISPSYINYIYY